MKAHLGSTPGRPTRGGHSLGARSALPPGPLRNRPDCLQRLLIHQLTQRRTRGRSRIGGCPEHRDKDVVDEEGDVLVGWRLAGLDEVLPDQGRPGLAGGPRRSTADGFEAHFATNHLGHFALTGLLLPALLARPGARIVTLTSSVAAQGRINFADLNSERRYRFIAAYSQSKLANLMFAMELNRRARAAAVPLTSTAVNPGIVATSLLRPNRNQWGRGSRPAELAVAAIQRLYGQPPSDGCLTSLYAATAPDLPGGEYIVPDGRGHKRGNPAVEHPPLRALDPETARRLWETSTDLTGVSYDALIPPFKPSKAGDRR